MRKNVRPSPGAKMCTQENPFRFFDRKKPTTLQAARIETGAQSNQLTINSKKATHTQYSLEGFFSLSCMTLLLFSINLVTRTTRKLFRNPRVASRMSLSVCAWWVAISNRGWGTFCGFSSSPIIFTNYLNQFLFFSGCCTVKHAHLLSGIPDCLLAKFYSYQEKS